MRVASTPTNDPGLSESTYELISGTDSESQDGNYTESMGESVGSLDFHRPDDVHSLAGTEHTQDEESVLDETEPQPPLTAGGSAVIVEVDDDVQDDAQSEQADDVDSESDDGAASRSSLEYTQQSLKTPSISAPEPTKFEYWLDDDEDQLTFKEKAKSYLELAFAVVYGLFITALPALTFSTFCIIMMCVLNPSPAENRVGQVTAPVSAPGTIITHQLPITTKTSSAPPESATSSNGLGLIPVNDAASDDWIFGTRKLEVGFSPLSPGEVLFHVPPAVKQAWLQKDCVEIEAKRSDSNIETTTSSVEKGILIKFPKKETHGVVSLAVKSTCRPRMHKKVEVHFGKGIVEEALEMTKHFAHDLGELVPAAAQEAERCFENAKRSLETVSDNLGNNVQSLSSKVAEAAKTSFGEARKTLHDAKQEVRERLRKGAMMTAGWVHDLPAPPTLRVPDIVEVQDQLQLGLLNAQISAKLWWLKVTDRKKEYWEYQSKARDFLASKLAEAKSRHDATNSAPALTARSWTKFMNRGRCQPTAGRGQRGVHKCIPES